MSSWDHYPWTVHLVAKLLHDDPAILRLVERNPFPDHPPRWIRVTLYRYRFARPGPDGLWWERTPVGPWLPPLSADDPRLRRVLDRFGWATFDSPASNR
jgi:hypothetical protein